jgi:hypothetical protein
MGTHAITHIKDEEGRHITSLFRHWDGNPSNHGKEVAEFLVHRKIVKGIPLVQDNQGKRIIPIISNGMSDLAAQLVCHLKSENEVGNIYLQPREVAEEGLFTDYTYTITGKEGDKEAYIKVEGQGYAFEGRMSAFLDYIIGMEKDENND